MSKKERVNTEVKQRQCIQAINTHVSDINKWCIDALNCGIIVRLSTQNNDNTSDWIYNKEPLKAYFITKK